HRASLPPADRGPQQHQPSQGLRPSLPQAAAETAQAAHPLSHTAAAWLWLVPLLPLLGFVINATLSIVAAYRPGPTDPSAAHGDDSHGEHLPDDGHDEAGGHEHGEVPRHRFAGITSIAGPGGLILSFIVAVAIFMAMRAAGGGAMESPFIPPYLARVP